MRPLALGWTTYLLACNALYLITQGAFASPDRWSELYVVVLGTYAGGAEVKHWVNGTDHPDPSCWMEKIRKGGPLVMLWNLLLAAAGALRLHDPSWPMPPELKTVTLQVTALFFGTYALRQVRRRAVARSRLKGSPGEAAREDAEDSFSAAADPSSVAAYLKDHGPSSPATLVEALGISRRSLNRLLRQMTTEGTLRRQGRYATDPNATYQLP